MSFRDQVVQDDSSSSTSVQPELHPVRDLIDTMRTNRELRRQARQERREQVWQQRHQSDSPPVPSDHTKDQVIRNGEQIARPMPAPVVPAPNEPAIRVMNEYPQAPGPKYFPMPTPGGVTQITGDKTAEPPLAKPAEQGEKRADNSTPPKDAPSNQRLLPDTITVKELKGQSVAIPTDKQAGADERLDRYLQGRGEQLSELDLNGSSVSDKGLALLNKAPNLSKLLLNDSNVDNNSMVILGLQGLHNLQDLNLHSTRVGDDGIAALHSLRLNSLNIADTAVSDDCMQSIKAMRTIQILNADYSGIGNEGAKAFKDMPNLRSLSLKGCPITDDCVKELAQAQSLMVLNLEDTRLSNSSVTWLQRQMPRCVITGPDGQGAHKAGLFRKLFGRD